MPPELRFKIIEPRSTALEDCKFYHSFSFEDGVEVTGEWDLRATADAYLGRFPFKGKSVLEVGPASGFLTFWMERAGATLTCLEPPMAHLWDLVPFAGYDRSGFIEMFEPAIWSVRNSFWHAHARHRSAARVIEADPYRLPEAIGDYEVGVLASVLLHCRSPITMLEQVASRVTKTLIVTEMHNPDLGDGPVCYFLPHRAAPQIHTWWQFTPMFFIAAMGLLGFTEYQVTMHSHSQPSTGQVIPMFTVIGSRPGDPETLRVKGETWT